VKLLTLIFVLTAAPQAPKLAPLPIALPKPLFEGTPEPPNVPDLEKPSGRMRPPFLAPAGATNFARGKAVSSSDDDPVLGTIEIITDGNKAGTDGAFVQLKEARAYADADIGLIATLHQHTDTCVMTSEEVYAVMEAVDTRYVKFGPDVAQLAKGGADPVKIVKDFVSIIRSVHLKDFLDGPHWAGYCPLGQGKVDIPAVLDVLETSKDLEWVMVELDGSRDAPMTPFETAQASKEYLIKVGYTFRS
jgi:sugar phosphate isomerase/epimerase